MAEASSCTDPMTMANGIDNDGVIDFQFPKGDSDSIQFVGGKASELVGADEGNTEELAEGKPGMEGQKKDEEDLNRLFQEVEVKEVFDDLMIEGERKGGLLEPRFHGFLNVGSDMFNEQYKALKGLSDQADDLDLEIASLEVDLALLSSRVDQAAAKFEEENPREPFDLDHCVRAFMRDYEFLTYMSLYEDGHVMSREEKYRNELFEIEEENLNCGVEEAEAQSFIGSHPACDEFKNEFSDRLNQHLKALKELIVQASDLDDAICCLVSDFETLHLEMNKAIGHYGKPITRSSTEDKNMKEVIKQLAVDKESEKAIESRKAMKIEWPMLGATLACALFGAIAMLLLNHQRQR